MRLVICLLLALSISAHLTAQSGQNDTQSKSAIPTVVDSLYREDQFYIGLSFNLLSNTPDGFSQNGFSGGLHLGFIRDMPFNERRNKAIGVGLGWSVNSYNSNVVFTENNGNTQFAINPAREEVESNRFNTNLIEMPIQYRWRTSTPTEFSFWRIYTGIKIGYLYSFKSSFDSPDGKVVVRQPDGLNRWRYFATFTVGNGSFNAFVQYGLNTLFKDVQTVEGNTLDLQSIKFGIEFYLL